MDLLRFSGEGGADRSRPILFDRPSFHSGSYFFTVIHVTETRIMFEVWSTETPCDPEKFEEEVIDDDRMNFKLSVYCRRAVMDMNYTMKTSPTGDPFMLLDCEMISPDIFKPSPEIQYNPLEPVLDYVTIGDPDTEDSIEYPIAVDRVIPQIQDITIPITNHSFLTTIRIGKIGIDLDDRLLDYLYDTYIKEDEQLFQHMIGYDQSHYIQFTNATRANLSIDQITIDVVTLIRGVDGLAIVDADLTGITCMIDQEIFPISSKDYDHTPNLLLIAPYFYRKDNFLPYVQKIESIKTNEDQTFAKIAFKPKLIQFFDSAEEMKKSPTKNSNTLLQYAKVGSFDTDNTSYEVSVYMRNLTRVDKYRTGNKKPINPIGYAQVTAKDKNALINQKSSAILKGSAPYILEFLGIDVPLEFQIIYREPTKLHLVF